MTPENDEVCIPCGVKFLTEKQKQNMGVVTSNKGICCLCKKETSVVHIRHYNYLKNSTMTKELLLMSRYKVIASWPNADLPVNLVVTNYAPGKWGDNKEYEFSESELWFKRYPHLFKKLEWWEDRDIKDMPQALP